MAMPDEGEQVVEELADPGGANEVVQFQFADAPAQVDPEVLVVKYTELFAAQVEKIVAILVKGRDPEAGQISPAQLFFHPLAHFLGCVPGVGDGKDFVGTGVAFADKTGDALGQDSGFPGAGPGDDEQRPVDVFDSFPLAFVRLESSGT